MAAVAVAENDEARDDEIRANKIREIHANSEIVEVELAKLKVDRSYQRELSDILVDEIANDYDEISAELITVSNRGPRLNDPNGVEGGLFIVNGQHRSKGAQKKGKTKIWARVIDLKKEADPGALESEFRLRTNHRLSDRPLERFKAQLRAKNEESLAIVKILAEYDAVINVTNNPEKGINCVSTIEALYRMDDGSLLGDTMSLVKDVWDTIGGSTSNSGLLKGVCWFIEKHAEESDRTRLVSKLKGIGTQSLEARARTMNLSMGGAMWVNYYRALVDMYNEQLREKNRLQFRTRGKSKLAKGGAGNRGV